MHLQFLHLFQPTYKFKLANVALLFLIKTDNLYPRQFRAREKSCLISGTTIMPPVESGTPMNQPMPDDIIKALQEKGGYPQSHYGYGVNVLYFYQFVDIIFKLSLS